MPTLTFNMDKTVRYRGREEREVRRILSYADRYGAMAATEKFDVNYPTVYRWCRQAEIGTKGSFNSNAGQELR